MKFFPFPSVFRSPEHKVLRVSHCVSAVSVMRLASSVVNILALVHSKGHIFSPIIMKLSQNVCLDEIWNEFENESGRVKN